MSFAGGGTEKVVGWGGVQQFTGKTVCACPVQVREEKKKEEKVVLEYEENVGNGIPARTRTY